MIADYHNLQLFLCVPYSHENQIRLIKLRRVEMDLQKDDL